MSQVKRAEVSEVAEDEQLDQKKCPNRMLTHPVLFPLGAREEITVETKRSKESRSRNDGVVERDSESRECRGPREPQLLRADGTAGVTELLVYPGELQIMSPFSTRPVVWLLRCSVVTIT